MIAAHTPAAAISGLLLLAVSPAAAQRKPVDLGQLGMVSDHATWPAPESIVRDLRSSNDDIHQKALGLAGLSQQLRTETTRPAQIELRYAAFGSDATQQAILAVQVGDYGIATVATQKGNGWERVAQFYCWCKYDTSRLLDEFVEIARAPDLNVERFELVLRASGGGSGLYNQDEVHFRFHRGEMKPVLHFKSRYVTYHLGIPEPSFEIERRWFRPGIYESGQGVPGGVLVEGHASLPPNSFPPIELSTYDTAIRDLESRHLGRLTCRTYKWNENTFQYVPSPRKNPCNVAQQ